MRKICIIIGSRANWGRLQSVCKAIQKHPDLELQLITGASGIELPVATVERVQCLIEGDNHQAMTLTTGLFLCQIGGVLERLKPDILLVHGDRFELMAPAIAAAYQNIKIAHSEGGEQTGTIDNKVRPAISALADIHFPVTEQAAKRLISAGANPDMVFTVGSPAFDTLVGLDLTNTRKEPYLLILHHPNTTHPEDVRPLIDAVITIPMKKIWVAPNVDPGSKAMLKIIHRQDVEFVKHLSPEDYARLLCNCECAVGNSSSFIKEGAYFGIGAVIIGDRQRGRECGNNIIKTNYDVHSIMNAINRQLKHGRYRPDYRFGNGTAGKQIVDILAKVEVKEKKLIY